MGRLKRNASNGLIHGPLAYEGISQNLKQMFRKVLGELQL